MWIIYEGDDGRAILVALAGRREAETDEQWAERIAAAAVPHGARWFAVSDRATIPDPGPGQMIAADWGAKTLALVPKPGTPEEVNAERDRRERLPVIVTVAEQTFPVDTRHERDYRNINGLLHLADLYQKQGQHTQRIGFTGADNVRREFLPDEMYQLALQVFGRNDRLNARALALKGMNPIPADITDDEWWS